MSTKDISINAVRTDGGTQMRAELSTEVFMDYRDKVLAGVEFPPLDVFFDGSEYWLADGFHRFYGHREAKKVSVKCVVHNGTVRDAILFAVAANTAHGLPRTRADKRNAVTALLNDDQWVKWSDGKIAEQAAVTQQFVSTIRKELTIIVSSPAAKTKDEPKVGKDGKARRPPKKPAKAKQPASASGSNRNPGEGPPKSLPTEGAGNQSSSSNHRTSGVEPSINDADCSPLLKPLPVDQAPAPTMLGAAVLAAQQSIRQIVAGFPTEYRRVLGNHLISIGEQLLAGEEIA